MNTLEYEVELEDLEYPAVVLVEYTFDTDAFSIDRVTLDGKEIELPQADMERIEAEIYYIEENNTSDGPDPDRYHDEGRHFYDMFHPSFIRGTSL